jgi:hypothetical protein
MPLRTNKQYLIKKSCVSSVIQTKDGFILHAAGINSNRSSRNELDHPIFKILINCKKDEEKFQLERQKQRQQNDKEVTK